MNWSQFVLIVVISLSLSFVIPCAIMCVVDFYRFIKRIKRCKRVQRNNRKNCTYSSINQ